MINPLVTHILELMGEEALHWLSTQFDNTANYEYSLEHKNDLEILYKFSSDFFGIIKNELRGLFCIDYDIIHEIEFSSNSTDLVNRVFKLLEFKEKNKKEILNTIYQHLYNNAFVKLETINIEKVLVSSEIKNCNENRNGGEYILDEITVNYFRLRIKAFYD